MERLTKRSNKTVHDNGVCCTHFMGFECSERMGECTDNCPWEEAVWSKLADYEDKEEQGLLISLPVPLGTMVFAIDTEWEDDSNYYYINEYRFRVDMLDEWGKWVFATESEAEEALAKMGE